MSQTVSFFVYGTLKTGQCREKYWPIRPLSVVPAWTFGQLYDLGSYPAMLLDQASLDGKVKADRVAGQLWSFRQSDSSAVIQVLDRIECTNQAGYPNEYNRVEVSVTILASGNRVSAQAYIYACAPQLRKTARRVPAVQIRSGQFYAVWPEQPFWPD